MKNNTRLAKIEWFKATILERPSCVEEAAPNMTLNKPVNKAKDRQKNSNTIQTTFRIKRNNRLPPQRALRAFLSSQLPDKMNRLQPQLLPRRLIALGHLASISIIVIAKRIQSIKKPAKLLIKIRMPLQKNLTNQIQSRQGLIMEVSAALADWNLLHLKLWSLQTHLDSNLILQLQRLRRAVISLPPIEPQTVRRRKSQKLLLRQTKPKSQLKKRKPQLGLRRPRQTDWQRTVSSCLERQMRIAQAP